MASILIWYVLLPLCGAAVGLLWRRRQWLAYRCECDRLALEKHLRGLERAPETLPAVLAAPSFKNAE